MKTRKQLSIFLALLLCAALLMAASCGSPTLCEVCEEKPCVCEPCEVCGEKPCVCEFCEICEEKPCVCEPCEVCGEKLCVCPPCEICEEKPCVCPEPTFCAICKEDPCVCPPLAFLQGEYSISYNVTRYRDGELFGTYSITITRAAAGYYFQNIHGQRQIYEKVGDIYNKYDFVGGAWYYDVFGQIALYDDELLAEIAEEHLAYYVRHCEGYAGIMEKIGSETIAGRNCDKYTFTVGSVKYTAWIDQATGACLKLQADGFAGEWFDEFECSEFRLTNVSLPRR